MALTIIPRSLRALADKLDGGPSVEGMIRSKSGLWVHPNGRIAPRAPIGGGSGAVGGGGGVSRATLRNVYAPNFYDSWGFYGPQIRLNTSGTGGTDPQTAALGNMPATGWMTISGAGISGTATTGVAGRWPFTVRVGNTAGAGTWLGGCHSGAGATRYVVPGLPDLPASLGYTTWVGEADIKPDTLATTWYFFGLASQQDILAAGAYATGVVFNPANDPANWRAINVNNGAITYGASGVAASTSAFQTLRAEVSASSTVFKVNGSTIAAAASNHPGNNNVMMPSLISKLGAGLIYVDRCFDWYGTGAEGG